MKRTLGSKAWVSLKQISLSGICKQDLLCRTTTCRAYCLQKELEHRLLVKN